MAHIWCPYYCNHGGVRRGPGDSYKEENKTNFCELDSRSFTIDSVQSNKIKKTADPNVIKPVYYNRKLLFPKSVDSAKPN